MDINPSNFFLLDKMWGGGFELPRSQVEIYFVYCYYARGCMAYAAPTCGSTLAKSIRMENMQLIIASKSLRFFFSFCFISLLPSIVFIVTNRTKRIVTLFSFSLFYNSNFSSI